MIDEAPMVLVEWLDAWGSSSGNWTSMNDIVSHKPYLINTSMGYLVARKEGLVTIVPHQTDPKHPDVSYEGSGDMQIPEVCVVRIWKLRKDGLL